MTKKFHTQTPKIQKLLRKSIGEIKFPYLKASDVNMLTKNFKVSGMYPKGSQIVVKIRGSN